MSPEDRARALEDRQLIREILQGDTAQYRKLVEKYQYRVINLVACVTGNRNEAEDIAQKIFIKVFYSLKRFDPTLPFFPWLYRVSVNHCYDELRRSRRKKQTFFSDLEPVEAEFAMEPNGRPDRSLEREKLAGMVHKLLFSLPPHYREALILKDIGEHSYEEMAEILGCSMQAVRLKVFRARNILRKKITNLMKEERQFLSNY